MNLVIAIAIIFAACQLPNTKAQLSIVSYDIDLIYYDPEHFRDPEVYIEDEGKDNEFFINVTMIKSVPLHTTNSLKLIGASMGEFVVQTGIDFTVAACDALKEPIFGKRLYHSLGVPTDLCPSPPGVYGNSHINLVDTDTLPDTFLPNNYKMIIAAEADNHTYFELAIFFKIQ